MKMDGRVRKCLVSIFGRVCRRILFALIILVVLGFYDGAAKDIDAVISTSGVIHLDGDCIDGEKKKVYLGLRRNYYLGSYESGYLFYENYLDDVFKQLASVNSGIEVEYVSNPAEANVAFYPKRYLKNNEFSTSFFSLRNNFFREDDQAKEVIIEKEKLFNSEYKRYEQGGVRGDAYCHSLISNKPSKMAFIIFPVEHQTQTHLSGRGCLRMAALQTFCINIEGGSDEFMRITNLVFEEKKDGYDSISEYGKKLIRALF